MKRKDESVFRVFDVREFQEFEENKYFYGNNFDKNSGFIHLSLKKQIKGTIETHFPKQRVIITEFNIRDLETLLKWEKSRDSMEFPHFFGVLEFRWVRSITENY